MAAAPAYAVGTDCRHQRGRSAMDDELTTEEHEEGEETSGTSGTLTLDGEAWRNRGDTTYNSLLDINGVTDLFSQESTDQYNDRKQESDTERQELTEYLFSGQAENTEENEEENEADMIFSEEIRLSRSRDYSSSEEDYSVCFVMAEIIFVLLFLYLLIKINAVRRKRREAHAAEINMENRRTA